MLEFLRRQSQLGYFLFGGVIIVFIFSFGPAANSCRHGLIPKSQYAVRVNGTIISQAEFIQFYQEQLSVWRKIAAQRKQEIDLATLERSGLRQQVIEELIQRELVAQEAANLGIFLSDAALAKHLRQYYGVKNVSFSTYQRWIQQKYGTNITSFENKIRAELAATTLIELLSFMMPVGILETQQDFSRLHDRAKIIYTRFAVEHMKIAEPSSSEVAEQLKNNRSQIEARYNLNNSEYREPEKVQVRLWRRQVRPQDNETVTTALARTQAQMQQESSHVTTEEQFVRLQTNQNNNEMSPPLWVAAGTLAPELENSAFALQVHQVSQPIVTNQNTEVVILWSIDKKKEFIKPFEAVAEEVAHSAIREQRGLKLAQQAATTLFQHLQQGKKWEQLTLIVNANTNTSIKPQQTDWILRSQEQIPHLGRSQALMTAIFTQTKAPMLLPQVFRVGQSFVVVEIKERETPDFKHFAAEKEELQQQALEVKRNRFLRDYVASLRNKAKIQINPLLLNVSG